MIEPWAHGTRVRARRFPRWWAVNALVVGRAEGLTADALVAAADEWLTGLGHRKVELEDAAAGAPLAAELRERGWTVERLVAMHRAGPAPAAPAVERLDRGAADELSVEWLLEEEVMPDEASVRGYLADDAAGEAMRAGAFVRLGWPEVGFVSLHVDGDQAEIEDAYVTSPRRGEGLGTALLQAALAHAGARDMWILADADGRPRHLYERLGFEPAWTYWDCVRRPPAKSDAPRR